jgi:23S rRNA (uridine2552-2'-O)-methyltransferase
MAKKRKPTRREGTVRVKSARGRKSSSTRWLQRQLNDHYVQEAQRLGYRSRAAFKLLEMDDKYKFLKPNMTIVDLGAAPGGWCQVAKERGSKHVVAIDILPMDPLAGVTALEMDFTDNEAPDRLKEHIGGYADVVLSDMAPNTIGHKKTDHLRIMALVEMAYEFAAETLKPGGVFVSKVFQGGASSELMAVMKKDFEKIRNVKPKASRKESAEEYMVCTGFRR